MKRFDLIPEKLLFLENFNRKTVFGSGLRQTHEEQIVSLTQSVAQQRWFDPNTEVQKYSLEEIEAAMTE